MACKLCLHKATIYAFKSRLNTKKRVLVQQKIDHQKISKLKQRRKKDNGNYRKEFKSQIGYSEKSNKCIKLYFQEKRRG